MLLDITTASPPYKIKQLRAAEELKKRMAGSPVISRLIDAASSHSGIEERYIVIPDGEENIEKQFYSDNGGYINPGTQIRMREYEKWAKHLSEKAVAELIDKNNLNPSTIEKLITISCTGFFAPGIDYHLIEKFKFSPAVKRTNIGFMGCAASIIGINSVLDILNSSNGKETNVLLISVELCSLHLQTEATRDNILANMIFADGCASALFSNSKNLPGKKSLKIIDVNSFLFKNSSEYMGWKIGSYGFEMILSPELPKIILEEASPHLLQILSSKNISKNNIKHWALHPGGRAILDSLQEGLQLSDEQVIHSRNVLKNYGNMSSASILFVLKEIMQNSDLQKDDYCCAVAFGPGLTMEAALFKVV